MKYEFNCPHDIYLARCEVEKLATWYSLRHDKKPDSYIWDEDLTVRQNKEKTAEYNLKIEQKIEQLKRVHDEEHTKFTEAVHKYIKEEFEYTDVSCNDAQAKIIWDYCLVQHEDSAHNWIHDVCELFEKLVENQGC